MAVNPETVSMALFCDFENVALGVRDANYEKFDIKPVLERLLLKGSIVVKKAYCDWDRYKGFKAGMHEANFELIEIPHVRQSGKNSADIRLVVDALDLCYTKSHVDTFVIISGDSDFSPLVSKLRENAKYVIGVGVKQSTSDLLIANCDEFIFYDDLVREMQRQAARRDTREVQPAGRRPSEDEKRPKEELEARRTRAIDLAVSTFDALVDERGDSGKIWASVLKEAIKRRKPDFNEARFGFRAFGNLLEEAQARGLLEFGRDEKSGAYVYRSSVAPVRESQVFVPPNSKESEAATAENAAPAAAPSVAEPVVALASEVAAEAPVRSGGRRQGRNAMRRESSLQAQAATGLPADQITSAEVAGTAAVAVPPAPASSGAEVLHAASNVPGAEAEVGAEPARTAGRRQGRGGGRKTSTRQKPVKEVAEITVEAQPESAPAEVSANPAVPVGESASGEARKPAARSRRPHRETLI